VLVALVRPAADGLVVDADAAVLRRIDAMALRPASRRLYKRMWLRFVDWHRDAGLGRMLRTTPIDPLVARKFVAHLLLTNQMGSVNAVPAVLRKYGTVAWTAHEERAVAETLRGALYQFRLTETGQAGLKDARSPVPADVWDHWSKNKPDGWTEATHRRWVAMACLSMALLRRPAEVLAIELADVVRHRDGTHGIFFRSRKNDPLGLRHGREEVRLGGDEANQLLARWLQVRRTDGTGSPLLFAGARGEPPAADELNTATTAVAALYADWLPSGTNLKGYSWRVTGVRRMMDAGASTADIQAAGGWRSPNTVAAYMRPESAQTSAIIMGEKVRK